jgi:hypothetical protein
MRASSRSIGAALAERLDEVVPRPCRVTEQDGSIRVTISDKAVVAFATSVSFGAGGDSESTFEGQVETDVRAVLGAVQDAISEHLREPWPSTDRRQMALPDVHRDGDQLHMWYGEQRAPVVSLRAITLVGASEA